MFSIATISEQKSLHHTEQYKHYQGKLCFLDILNQLRNKYTQYLQYHPLPQLPMPQRTPTYLSLNVSLVTSTHYPLLPPLIYRAVAILPGLLRKLPCRLPFMTFNTLNHRHLCNPQTQPFGAMFQSPLILPRLSDLFYRILMGFAPLSLSQNLCSVCICVMR